MFLLSIALLISKISLILALTCYNYDKGNSAETTCPGTYCVAMKYSAVTKSNTQLATVVKGCYNWQLNVAEMGCYTGVADEKMQNVVVCFCDSDKCNTDDLLNSTPKTPRRFTCEHSKQDTCTGYACTVAYTQVLGGNPIIERDCDTQPFGGFEAKIKANIGGPTTLQPYCKESLAYNKTIGFFTKKECTCYEDQCNSAENESKLPAIPDKPMDCLAEYCEGNSPCIKANREGVCKGQYCIVQVSKSRETGTGRPEARGKSLLRTCGALSSELADTTGTLGVNYTLTNSAATMFKESEVKICSSGRCNTEPQWQTGSGSQGNRQTSGGQQTNRQTVQTRQETIIRTNQRSRNSGNVANPAFLTGLASIIFMILSLKL